MPPMQNNEVLNRRLLFSTSEQIPKEQGQEEDDDESFNVDVNMNMDDLLSEIK